MSPFVLDFVRPRYMGGTSCPVWGSFMMFRSPDLAPTRIPLNSQAWDVSHKSRGNCRG